MIDLARERRLDAQLLASQLATALALPELVDGQLELIERGAEQLAGAVRDTRAAAMCARRRQLVVVK